MQKKFILILVVEAIVGLVIIVTAHFQTDLYSQTSYQTIHLTQTEWDIITIRVQDWTYSPTNGTAIPTSGFVTYPNYPFIVLWFFLPLNFVLIVNLLRSKETKPTTC